MGGGGICQACSENDDLLVEGLCSILSTFISAVAIHVDIGYCYLKQKDIKCEQDLPIRIVSSFLALDFRLVQPT
jgi:hypothetical protein